MDFVNKLANSQSGDKKHEGGSNSSGGGIGDKLNSMAGGGSKGEKNEDLLDKGKILLSASAVNMESEC